MTHTPAGPLRVGGQGGRALAVLAVVAALLLSGCTSTDCPAPAGVVALTPEDAAEGRLAEGALVRWGGILAATRNLAARTELDVIGYPLTSCGRPRTGNRSVGRFVIVHPGYLETAQYRPGEMVSATGRFIGLRPNVGGGSSPGYPHMESFHPQRWGESPPAAEGYWRPRISIGIGGGSGGGIGGGVGVVF